MSINELQTKVRRMADLYTREELKNDPVYNRLNDGIPAQRAQKHRIFTKLFRTYCRELTQGCKYTVASFLEYTHA